MTIKKIATLSILFFFFSFCFYGQVRQAQVPNWVQKSNYETTPKVDLGDNSDGILELLMDHQINNESKEIYYRYARKILENVGIQNASSINIMFDPSYQKLSFHHISVIREGKTIQKLNPSDFQLIRKEMNTESFIYDGTMSAINNLSDIRNGDIIDYSYTIKGANPIHEGKFATLFPLNAYVPFGKINYIISSRTPIKIEYKNASSKFRTIIKNGLYQYKYSETNVPACDFEENIPQWYFLSSYAFVSDYKSWKEIANWGARIFKVTKPSSPKLNSKIQDIKKKHKGEGARITAVLKFAQDEIRYLGLESGIGAYKPFQPNKVFEQRFGDCKDKSLLVVHMLRQMNIEAYPVLLSTYYEDQLQDLIPSSRYFDHCIVKVIDKSGEQRWYDPTISNQGGDYRNTSLPNYKLGLTLKRNTNNLEEIVTEVVNNVDVTDEFVLEKVGKGATLKTTSLYYDSRADFMRGYFKNNGIKSINKDYEKYMSSYYANIKATKNPTYEDNINDNIFKVVEHYKIDSIWTDDASDKRLIIASFQPYTIIDALAMPTHRERKYPFYLEYPSKKNHTIKIKLPERWNIENEFMNITPKDMEYSFVNDYVVRKNLLTLKYSIDMKNDHVLPEDFDEFYTSMSKIDNTIGYALTYPKPRANSFNLSNVDFKIDFSVILITLIIIILFVFVIVKFVNK